jgi:hypothetical protein
VPQGKFARRGREVHAGRKYQEAHVVTFERLVEVERALRETRTLSIYVEGGATNPADRRAWRARLIDAIDKVRTATRVMAGAELVEFDRAVGHLMAQIELIESQARSAGWMGLVTADGVKLSEELPRVPIAYAAWRTGACIAPMLRSLSELHSSIVAVVNSREARIFRCTAGEVEPLEVIPARLSPDEPTHMGAPSRLGFHSGVAGETGAELVQREARESLSRLASDTSSRIAGLAGAEGWIVIGGTPTAARETFAALPKAAVTRSIVLSELQDHATLGQVAAAASEGASRLRRVRAFSDVQGIVDAAGASGRGAVGMQRVRLALEERRAADQLYVTENFVREHPEEATELVSLAIDQDARIEVAPSDAAEPLDAIGGGVAARLRWAVPAVRDAAPRSPPDRPKRNRPAA